MTYRAKNQYENKEYQEERNAEIEKIIKNSTIALLRGQKVPELLEAYIEDYGSLIYSCFNGFDLHQLQAMTQVRFIADGVGKVEFVFKYSLMITEHLEKMIIVPTKAGHIKLIAPIQWVDRY